MDQVLLIGFSATGKSTLIKKLKSNSFCEFEYIDSDKYISQEFNGHIYDVYYKYSNSLLEAHNYITQKENEFIQYLIESNEKLIIAAGPGIPLRNMFARYVEFKKPVVVLLERTAEAIYNSLIERRNRLKMDSHNHRKDFGCWDIDVIVDKNLEEYPTEKAIYKIQELLDQRNIIYRKYADFVLNSEWAFDNVLELEKLIFN